ncbi:MAG: lysophospholipid acyltransferase family protein [Bacillota bacterium]
MFRNIKLFFILVIYLIKSQKLIRKIKRLGSEKEISQAIVNEGIDWGKMLLGKVKGNITVVGAEKLDPSITVCFISNHQSYFDIPIFLGYVKSERAFLAKVEILKVPILSEWMKMMHCVFIDRNDARKSVAAIKEATQNLKNGISMVVFPEGTRAKDGVIGDFKPGGFKMAINSEVPIVPVTIDGAFRFFEKGHKGQVNVRFVIGDSIETKGLSREEIAGLSEKVKQVIASNLEGK